MKRGNTVLWLAVCAWWALDGVVDSVQLMSMEGAGGTVLGARRAFTLGMASSLMWIPFTLVLLWGVRRFPIERGRMLRGVVANTLVVLGLVVLRAAAVVLLNPWIAWYREPPAFGEVLLTSVLNNFLLLWMMIGVAHAWYYARRDRERLQQAERLQARLVATRLESLNAQLNPHFMFNALNSIAEMVHRDPEAADRMLVGLGELLRASLEHGRVQTVPLSGELALLRHYLGIEAQRLGERLKVEWQIDDGITDALVPPLLLQPLAENAIVHAIAGKIRPGLLTIRIGQATGRLWIAIEDDGGVDQQPGRSHGTGLANLRARLALLYGDDYALDTSGNARGGTSVRIELPLRFANGVSVREMAA